MEAPATPARQHLDRDSRIKILTLREIGWTFEQIAKHQRVTIRQVQYACSKGHPTPSKRDGRSIFTAARRAELIEYVRQNRQTRRMSLMALATKFDTTVYIIRRALQQSGFSRLLASQKPSISETTAQTRLQWAQEHLNWTKEQWNSILWTDETWVTGKKPIKTWVTRRSDEVFHPDCIEYKIQRHGGWMFWGCFSGGLGKGPSLFWEKNWGPINKESYCERIVPLIHEWLTVHPELRLMQDGAPESSAQYTKTELQSRGVTTIFWPPCSPDLNPIETVWNGMQDYIQDKMDGPNSSYDFLRRVVKEAWEAVGQPALDDLINSMPERCQAVVDAEGSYTRF
jgi:hypothetical protein